MKLWCQYIGLSVAMFLIYMLISFSLAVGMQVDDGITRNGIVLFFMILSFSALLSWSYALGLWYSSWRISKHSCLILMAVFIAISLWESGLGLLKSGMTDNDKIIMQLFQLFPHWLMLIYICVVGPICEEILFRGVIMGRLPLKNPWWGIALSSLAFTAVHMPEDAVAWLMYGSLAVVLALIFYRTKSLVPGLIFHMANNALAAAMLSLHLD